MAEPHRSTRPLGPVEVLERFANGAHLVRIADGCRRGEVCVVASDVRLEVVTDRSCGWRPPTAGAQGRARELLATRCTERQRATYERTGTFWVLTPVAWVRLGTLYDLRVRTMRSPWTQRATCVVTERFDERPIDDLWTELLGWLAVDPAGFLRIGNPQPCAQVGRPPARRAELESWLRAGRDRWRALRAAGFELDAAHLAFELARALHVAGRPRWAADLAARAWQQVLDEASRFPDDAGAVVAAHEPIRSLAAALAAPAHAGGV